MLFTWQSYDKLLTNPGSGSTIMKAEILRKKGKAWVSGLKKIVVIAVSIMTLLLAALLWTGNYFVDIALYPGDDFPEPAAENDKAAEISAKENHKENQKAVTKVWLTTAVVKQVSLVSEDHLKLAGTTYLKEEGTHKWAILIHGYKGKKEEMRNMAQQYAERGYHILTPDLRAHGQSEGRYIGMGWLDRKDILNWIDFIIEKDQEAEIVLHGISMGGATVMMTAGEKLPEQVKVLIEDCGYTSVKDIFQLQLKELYHLPAFPILYAADAVARVRAGYGFKEGSALKQVAKSTRPILFIHGSEDDFVPTAMVKPLYEAASCEKDILVVENAGHAEAQYADPKLYFDTVFSFIEKYTG